MLQKLRDKAQGLMTWIIVLAIAAAFIFFGIGDYFSFGGRTQYAAKVNGEKISWQTVDNLYDRYANQYEGQVDSAALKQQILSALIQRNALLSAAKKQGFRVGEDQIAELLVLIPAFQVDGQFSKEQYYKVLNQASYTDAGFRSELMQDVLLGQFEQGLMQSSFATPKELSNLVGLLEQKRDFGYVLIPSKKFEKEIKIPAEKIQAYYDKHRSLFVKPEQVTLEYVELSLDQLAEKVKPTEEDIKAYYQEHQTAYTLPERVHARHILILAPENGEPKLDEEAKKKIEDLAKQLKQGANFEKLAKSFSNDPGSAEKGGDLGWFVQGQMVPDFEKAAFALNKPGSISDPVRTQFGYHLIQLIAHKKSEARSLAEVKHLVEEQLKREKAEQLYAEKAEQLAKLGFENKDSLEPLAEALGLKIQDTAPFSREGGQGGVASHPAVVEAAFSDALLKDGENSQPVKLSENATVLFRVKDHLPLVEQTFQQAEQSVRDILTAVQAKVEAKAAGEKVLKEVSEGGKPQQIVKTMQLDWTVKSNVMRSSTDVDRQVLVAAFQIAAGKDLNAKPTTQGFSLPNGDYLVMTLNKIIPGVWSKLPSDKQKAYLQGVEGASGQLEYALYVNQVLQEAKVQIKEPPE